MKKTFFSVSKEYYFTISFLAEWTLVWEKGGGWFGFACVGA
jgi:hypothetical protein